MTGDSCRRDQQFETDLPTSDRERQPRISLILRQNASSRLLSIEGRRASLPNPVADQSPANSVDTTPDPRERLSDEQLLDRYQRGDAIAFRVLYRRHRHRASALALRLTRDENDACEVVQEAFIRVLCSWSRFQGHAAFYTWLYRIICNQAIDRLRRSRRLGVPLERAGYQTEDAQSLSCAASWFADPFDACATQELWCLAAQAIQRLSPAQRDVIVLREAHGMSYAEIAGILHCSKGTVMSRLFHARQRLRTLLRCRHDQHAQSSVRWDPAALT